MVCNGVLAGIVSFGKECASPQYPGVYTDIRKYVEWIERNRAAQQGNTISIFSLMLLMVI